MRIATLQSLIATNANKITDLEHMQLVHNANIAYYKNIRQSYKHARSVTEDVEQYKLADDQVVYYTNVLSPLYNERDKRRVAINKAVALQKELKQELAHQISFTRAQEYYDDLVASVNAVENESSYHPYEQFHV